MIVHYIYLELECTTVQAIYVCTIVCMIGSTRYDTPDATMISEEEHLPAYLEELHFYLKLRCLNVAQTSRSPAQKRDKKRAGSKLVFCITYYKAISFLVRNKYPIEY